MDRPICFAKPRSVAGLRAQGEFLRHELEVWGDTGLGSELNCIVDHFFDALNALAEGPVAESPLRALYHRWQAAKAEYDAMPDIDDPTGCDLFRCIQQIEQQVADYEPKTVEDFAFKVIFADDGGDMNVNIHQVALAASAYTTVGIEPQQRGGARAEATKPDKPPASP